METAAVWSFTISYCLKDQCDQQFWKTHQSQSTPDNVPWWSCMRKASVLNFFRFFFISSWLTDTNNANDLHWNANNVEKHLPRCCCRLHWISFISLAAILKISSDAFLKIEEIENLFKILFGLLINEIFAYPFCLARFQRSLLNFPFRMRVFRQ